MQKRLTILLIGGAGYIGSHMLLALQEKNYQVIVLDNLSTGHEKLLTDGIKFIKGSLDNKDLLNKIFTENNIDVVMHFAAFIEVGESIIHPAKYYQNNLVATLTLLDVMVAHKVNYFIFSSTAAIFGEPQYLPIDSQHPKNPINPYGKSKLMVEQVLADYDRAYGLKYASLRYFNAAGADPQTRTGELHHPETHLIPLVLQVANNRRTAIQIYGDDYDTEDGTCIRDYIHVVDLCTAHELALVNLFNAKQSRCYNLGNGNGFSVKAIIDTAFRVTGQAIPIEYATRRPGDPAVLIADASETIEALNWQIQFPNLEDIILHAWQWELQCH